MSDTTVTQSTRVVEGVTLPAPGTFAIDASHTEVGFAARHMMVSKVRGRFTDFDGTIVVAENLNDSSVEVDVKTASINTADENRDNHVRSDDFLSVEKYPNMTFKSTKVEIDPKGAWTVTGDLTLRNVTRPVTLDVEFQGVVQDPFGNQRIGFTASGEISRDDFGVTFNAVMEAGGVVIGSKIKLEIEAEAVRQA